MFKKELFLGSFLIVLLFHAGGVKSCCFAKGSRRPGPNTYYSTNYYRGGYVRSNGLKNAKNANGTLNTGDVRGLFQKETTTDEDVTTICGYVAQGAQLGRQYIDTYVTKEFIDDVTKIICKTLPAVTKPFCPGAVSGIWEKFLEFLTRKLKNVDYLCNTCLGAIMED